MWFHVDSVFALKWIDKEWINAGCPSSVLGKWVSGHDEVSNGKSMVIKPSDHLTASGKGGLLITISSDDVNKASSTGNVYVNGDRFVEIMRHSPHGAKDHIAYLKIRPRLVRLENSFDPKKISFNDCYIKVFKFFLRQRAKADKYLDWNIYKLKKIE